MNPESGALTRYLEQKEFDAAVVRMGKYGRIAADFARAEQSSVRRQRIDEVRAIEQKILKKGRGGPGCEEQLIDTRGYREHQTDIIYSSPSGQTITVPVVMFYKKEGNKVMWLEGGGRTVVLHEALYRQRLESSLYGQARDRNVSFIPVVDGRGAYTGITSIIEDVHAQHVNRRTVEARNESLLPGFRVSTDLIASIAERFPLDTRNFRKPDAYFPPIAGNVFDDQDHPTLAGRMLCYLYDTLIDRPDYRTPQDAREYGRQGEKAFDTFNAHIPSVLNSRRKIMNDRIEFGLDREKGTDAFHFNGDTMPVQSFLFYFNKSTSHFTNPAARMCRAYITLDPHEWSETGKQFADLCTLLYDAGIDFIAKCCSPYGQAKRMDNIVLYISEPHRKQASALIKQFMNDRHIGKGHMMAAVPSDQDGLSWAYEPTASESKLWQNVSGSSRAGSFNMIIAMYALPMYLDKLVVACMQKADRASADIYRDEAKRVRGLCAAYRAQIE